jgi:pimeloyl-ACP methyl ester carboxylesterase
MPPESSRYARRPRSAAVPAGRDKARTPRQPPGYHPARRRGRAARLRHSRNFTALPHDVVLDPRSRRLGGNAARVADATRRELTADSRPRRRCSWSQEWVSTRVSTRGCSTGSAAGRSWWPTFAGGAAAAHRTPATHGRITSGICAPSPSRSSWNSRSWSRSRAAHRTPSATRHVGLPAELRCPVLVIRGGRRGRVVTDELAGQWQTSLPSVKMATIAGAGHDLWSRDPGAYLAVLLPFLERIGPG